MSENTPDQRSPDNEDRKKSGFRLIGFRASDDYAEWLTKAAKHDRMTTAAFLDKAARDRAEAIGYSVPSPDRIP